MINKRKSLILIFVLFIILSKASATGAGIQVGLKPHCLINQDGNTFKDFSGTLTGTLRFSRIPLVIGGGFEAGKIEINKNPSQDSAAFGFSAFADYWIADIQLINTCSFYSGFGACINLLTPNFKDFSYSAGARFFAGLDWLFYDNFLELFAQQNIVPTIKSNGDFFIALPLEAGIRMHF